MNPTRIIKEPTSTFINRRRVWTIQCDDGKTYGIDELAKCVGIRRKALIERFRKLGWDHNEVLGEPQKYGQYDRKKKSELSRLSGRVRSENLLKIHIGTWERQYLSTEDQQ